MATATHTPTSSIAPARTRRFLIVSADDLGLAGEVDRAVERAHREGVLTSASLVACGATAEGALALARRNPELGIGVHLTLVGERALLPHARLSHLTDREGRLPRGHGEFARRFLTGGIPLAEVEAELEAQVGRVRDSGIRPTHLDGHQHLHLLPGVLGAVLRLARRHGIAALRLPLGPGDPWWRGRLHASLGTRLAGLLASRSVRRSGLVHPGRVLGIADTGRLDGERIRRLAEGIPEGVSELVCHPANENAGMRRRYAWGFDWEAELAALLDPELPGWLADRGIRTVSYAALRGERTA